MAGDKKDKSARSKAKRRKSEKESETMEDAEATDVQPNEEPPEPEKHAEEPEPTETRERASCPVAGVGASAGGLEALQGLFEHVPRDLNAAFIVVQHRAADRTSVMRSLLEKHTQFTVKDIEGGMKVESGTLYLGPVEKMGEQLAQDLGHPFLAKPKLPDAEEKSLESQFQKIFILIRDETGHDFSHYKRNTIQRRISRRLTVHQVENLDLYVRFLQENPEEVRILAREMLITVTNFFRDHEAFERLQERVIAPLVNEKAPDSFLRVWVAGCATGEEAYSIAMMLYEEITRSQKHFRIQIFATDIDEESIETGRRGQFPKSIAGDVSPARLRRFFTEESDHYKIKGDIREMIVFAKHNIIKDAPFSELDLLCCRNVLIYLDSTLQKKLIPMFHYTLNPGGSLFLGESESVGPFSDLFTPVDARHKIFKRKPVNTGYEPETEVGYYPQTEPAPKGKAQTRKRQQAIGEIAENVIDGAVVTFVDITGQKEGK